MSTPGQDVCAECSDRIFMRYHRGQPYAWMHYESQVQCCGDPDAGDYRVATPGGTLTVTCPKCSRVDVAVRPSGYLASHNAPPNADGYVGRCGNRRVTLKETQT